MDKKNKKHFPTLIIGDLEIKKPIIQGGMGIGISVSGLASAVANEGGIGVISTVGNGFEEPDFKSNYREANLRSLRNEIKKAKSLTKGVLGVNIMLALTDYDDLFKASMNEGVDIIFMGAGLPLRMPANVTLDELKSSKTKLAPIVSSGKAARLIFQTWDRRYDYIPDAVVVEGPKAGGHLGFKSEQIFDPNFSLEKIVPDVVKEIKIFEEKYNRKIPVIAGGGVYTGADIDKILKLGASAVQMGTRFVATHECDASEEFKKAYVECKEEDIVIINSPVGLPGRAINSAFLEKVGRGEKTPISCPWKCLTTCDYKTAPYCIGIALINSKRGKIQQGYAFCGANAYRVKEIISVKELFETLEKEYSEAIIDS